MSKKASLDLAAIKSALASNEITDKGEIMIGYRMFSNICKLDSFKKYWNHLENSDASISNLDEIRVLLYFAFQPLYDALINDSVPVENRKTAIKLLRLVQKYSTKYFTSYYLGSPKPELIKKLCEEGKPLLSSVRDLRPFYKQRNIDYNGITAENIRLFLSTFLTKSTMPDVVVCCACGPSEITMALSGILKVKHVLMRYSHRRFDNSVKVIKEHKRYLKNTFHKKNVLCVEDYVCSGQSLREVMEKVKEYEPSNLQGASVNSGLGRSNRIKQSHSSRKFYLFELI